jgi:glucosamine--fructose-6-phosphate aminotransferase (isomerizing)
MFMPTDIAAAGMCELEVSLRAIGATLFCTGSDEAMSDRLPVLEPDHPDVDAVCLIQTFYAMVIRLAGMRGINADEPRHLQKVTRTQ